nr:TerD family protein [Micromonospora sp. DSM 115978]
MSKGANTSLPSSDVRVEVRSSTLLDIAAILVTPNGKVRSDADFVFFNQPTGPGVRLLPPSALAFSLAGVPADIDKLGVTGSLDGSGPATFAAVRDLVVVALDGRGTEVASFAPAGLSTETALVMVELYRRQGAWKLRAVGQGYASGLAGIATDFGIDVGDSPAPAVAPAPQAAPQPTSRPVTQPVAAPPPPPSPVAPSAAAANRPVNLDKGRVSLQKGQSVSLVKTGAPPLNKVRMGLGWDPAYGGRDIDLDASCILYDQRGKDVDKIWFMSKK